MDGTGLENRFKFRVAPRSIEVNGKNDQMAESLNIHLRGGYSYQIKYFIARPPNRRFLPMVR